jgi:hypothetical protein
MPAIGLVGYRNCGIFANQPNMKNVYFEPGDRHSVVVEDVADMIAAEREADRFLSEATSSDESGSVFVRIKSSGVKRNDRYYFKAVMVHNADGIDR